jgi:hypothetical protein
MEPSQETVLTQAERGGKIAKIRSMINEVFEISQELGLGNIFINEGFMELFLAEELGHTWNHRTQGVDAFVPDEEAGAEYKMRSSPNGYFQFHCLSPRKLDRLAENTSWVYFVTREQTEFTEIWRISMDALIPILNENVCKVDLERLIKKDKTKKGGHVAFSLNDLIELGAERVK